MANQPVIHIGQIIRNALVFKARSWQGAALPMDEILQQVQALFELLQQRRIEYTLVGGIALLQYIPGRNTEDIDLILHLKALDNLPEITISSRDVYFARGHYQDLQIDFLLTANPLFAHVQKQHVLQQPFFENSISSASVSGLLLLKLYALPSLYRQGNFARVGLYENDIATLMFYHQPDMPALLAELQPFLSDQDRSALDDVVADLQQRIARFSRSSGDVSG